MKKTLLSICSLLIFGFAAHAQENPINYLPTDEGTRLEGKYYDGAGTMQGTIALTVKQYAEFPTTDDSDILLEMVVTDNNGMLVSDGIVNARYADDMFYLDMKDLTMTPDQIHFISPLLSIAGSFLDHPDPFYSIDNYTFENGDFPMSAADFTIATKDGKPVTMRVFNRSLEKDEQVTTPAGTFDSSLISYNVEITYDGQRSELHGREWYVSGTGVVRSEIYDRNHDLQDYTVLTSIMKK